WPDVISRQCAIAFRHRRLADVITNETSFSVRSGERSERFACVNLSTRRDRFDAGSAANVRAAISAISSYRIVKLVSGDGVQSDTKTHFRRQTFLFQICCRDEMG